MPLNAIQYLVPASDHRYRVVIGAPELVALIPRRTVSFSPERNIYCEYAGDAYLEGDETPEDAPVLDN